MYHIQVITAALQDPEMYLASSLITKRIIPPNPGLKFKCRGCLISLVVIMEKMIEGINVALIRECSFAL
jgi:hypothetical protein